MSKVTLPPLTYRRETELSPPVDGNETTRKLLRLIESQDRPFQSGVAQLLHDAVNAGLMPKDVASVALAKAAQREAETIAAQYPEKFGTPGDELGLRGLMELNHMQLQTTGSEVAAETRPDADVGGKKPANPNGPLFLRFKDI